MSELVLEAPCVFCKYDGEGYWQAGTHQCGCPVGGIAGRGSRVLAIRFILHRLAARVTELEAENAKQATEIEHRRSVMSRFPFCSDHRDKVAGLGCRECAIERLKAEKAKLRAFIVYCADPLRRAFGVERRDWAEVIGYDAARAGVEKPAESAEGGA